MLERDKAYSIDLGDDLARDNSLAERVDQVSMRDHHSYMIIIIIKTLPLTGEKRDTCADL